MDRLPNGDIVINFEELQTSVVAVDLSPSRICNSTLAKRLRNAEYAATVGITNDDRATVKMLGEYGLVDRAREYKEHVADRELLDTSVTIIPQVEIADFEDSILTLTTKNLDSLAKYFIKMSGNTINRTQAVDFASLFQARANQLFDDLFPDDQIS